MELEFDKEIDALMRKASAGFGVTPSIGQGTHLDADELSAFAENAMPEKARALHMRHLADCDRCRKILSGLASLNSEAAPEMAAAATPSAAPADVPWYRRLFLFPNLAYTMGALVLIFGGLLTFSLIRNSQQDGEAVSQMTEAVPARGPMAATEPEYSSNTNAAQAFDQAPNTNSAANRSNTAAAPNTMANAASAAPKNEQEARRENDAALSIDGAAAEQPAAAAPLPPPPPAKTEAKDDVLAMKPGGVLADSDKEKAKVAGEPKQRSVGEKKLAELPRTQAGGTANATPGPSRDMQQTFPNRADNTFELNSRRVSGRDFQYKNGVWYDTAYRGQSTTNVRRGTEDYRKLDAGLRSIADTLKGVVVVVWERKAYRVQ